MFEELYKTSPEEIEAFGTYWCGPDVFEHGKEYLVARYEAVAHGDGRIVEVFCVVAPARFYTIRVAEGIDADGHVCPSYSLTTGSSMCALAARIAEAIADGMLDAHIKVCRHHPMRVAEAEIDRLLLARHVESILREYDRRRLAITAFVFLAVGLMIGSAVSSGGPTYQMVTYGVSAAAVFIACWRLGRLNKQENASRRRHGVR